MTIDSLPPHCGTKNELSTRLRALIAPLTVILTLTTAIALLVTATAMTPLPVTGAIVSTPRSSPIATVPADGDIALLIRSQPIGLPPAPLVIGLARLTYRPGAVVTSRVLPGPLLLVVESGAVVAHLDGAGNRFRAAGTSESVRSDCLLSAGDRLLLPASTAAAFRSMGTAPAVVLAAGVFPATFASSGLERINMVHGDTESMKWTPDWAPGATVESLAGGWAVDLTTPSAAIEITRVTLGPGEQTALAAPGVHALAVETGALTMSIDRGLVWLERPAESDESLNPGAKATLLRQEGALLQSGASATLRNDGSGPLQVLILTVARTDGA